MAAVEQTRIVRWVGAVFAIAAVAALVLGYDPRLLMVNWQDTSRLPFLVKSHLEVAREGVVLRHSSLSLVCGPTGLHLALQANLPLPSDYEWQGARDIVTIFVGDIQHKLELQSQLVDYGLVETMVTQALAPQDAKHLSTWLALPSTKKVSFMALETGTYMKPTATGSEVQAFASSCRPNDP